MPRDVASALIETLLDAFPASRAYAPADFERRPVPHPVAHFLKQRLLEVIQQEQKQGASARSEWVDHNHGDVQQARRAYHQAMARHAQIPSSDWEEELTQAVHRTAHYLVRPVPAAIRFIYVHEEPSALPARTVIDRLSYFSAYSYLQEAVKTYIDQREMESVDRTRLATLLTRVDQQMTEDYAPEQWLRLLEPLFEMGNAAFNRAVVPAEALRQFFKEKEQGAVVDRLGDAPSMVDRDSLRALLQVDKTADRGGTESASPEPARQEQPVAPSSSSSSEDDDSVPLWKQFQQRSAPSVANVVSSKQASNNGDRPRWEKFQPAPEAPAATAPLNELESEVLGPRGSRNRQRFVRQLFSGSEEEYREVLGVLREVNSWNEASQIIAREVFRKHQVNIYSDPAVSFTNAVEAQFRD